MQRLAFPLAVTLLAAAAAAQFQIVVPNGFAAAEGNASNAFPFTASTVTTSGVRVQQPTTAATSRCKA
jgi:hypothetical protein